MSDVQLIITIENDEQADKVLGVLNEGEVNGELDFPFDLQKRVRRTSPHLIQPTFSIGEDGEPMI